MKFIGLKNKELKYCATLDWDPLMSYLEKKYGILYKNEFKKRLENTLENDEARRDEKEKEKWK